jgi:hypothetical protein
MAYANFTKDELKKKFGVHIKDASLFNDTMIKPVQPSSWLLESLTRLQKIGFSTEKERSERLVTPILAELHQLNNESFKIYSGQIMNADEMVGLNGECDFLLAYGDVSDILETPIFTIAEAKKNDIGLGTIQCSAQLIGAKIFNEKEGYDSPLLFGCSTTGTDWRFIRYEDNTIFWDQIVYSLRNLPELLGVLQYIIDETKFYFDRKTEKY